MEKQTRPARHGIDRGARVMLAVVALGVTWAIHDIAYPARSLRTSVNGRPVHISMSVPDPISLGRELHNMPHFMPCSVQISVDTNLMQQYGYDGVLAWTAAHEVGHCMEKLLPTRRSALEHPHPDAGWSAEVERSEAYADAWGSLYLIRCGINLAPLGWTQEGGKLEGSALRTAQTCIPRPEEVKVYRNPGEIIEELRGMRGLDTSGIPVAGGMRSITAILARSQAAISGIDVHQPPPGGFKPGNAHDLAWIQGKIAYRAPRPPGPEVIAPQGSLKDQVRWARSRSEALEVEASSPADMMEKK